MADATYALPDLPYDPGALEPHISGRIMELHHDKHHATYVKGANTALEKLGEARTTQDFATISMLERNLAFHVSGHVLHSVFWTNLSPDGGGEPTGTFNDELATTFGGFLPFRQQMTEAAATVQGSGWALTSWEPTARRLVVQPVHLSPGRARARHHPAPRHRRLGARLLPAVRERQGRVLRRHLERRQLDRRRTPLRRGTRR